MDAVFGSNVFMGTIQFACESRKNNEYQIIDGQQRMVTFCLLCGILEKKSVKNIIGANKISFDIRNFESNNEKLAADLMTPLDEIEKAKIYYWEINKKSRSEDKKHIKTSILKAIIITGNYPVIMISQYKDQSNIT